MEIPVFDIIEVYNRYRGGALVAWSLSHLFSITAPITFTVSVSRTGVDDWHVVGTVVNDFAFTDSTRWLYGLLPSLFYKVSFTQDGTVYESDLAQVDGILMGKDKMLAREIVRKERLRFRMAGACGMLYKRRRWGVKCPVCLDWDTEEVKNGHCTTCYGTGFTGGYFDPVEYWISDNAGASWRQVSDPTRGQVIDYTRAVRGLNCPWVDSGDFWVDTDSDMRYVIHTISKMDIRGVTVMFPQIEMRLAPSTDIIYSISRPD